MAYSRIVAVGDGSTKQFAVNFALDYLQPADVTCRVGNEVDGSGAPSYRTITFLSTNLVQISGSAPGNGVKVVFERTVSKSTLNIDYNDGDQLDEDNLMIAQKQAMMAVHEVLDGRFAQLTQDIDAGGFSVVNLRAPIADTDAVNKTYVDGLSGPAAVIASAASASSAAASAALTAADRVQTGADRVQTGADRVQTGADRIAASNSAAAAVAAAASIGNYSPPQFRLSLVSGVPTPTNDVVNQSTVYVVSSGYSQIVIPTDVGLLVSRGYTPNTPVILDATAHTVNNTYDVFAYWTGSSVAFGFGPAWTVGTGGSAIQRGQGTGSTQVDTAMGGYTTNANPIVLRNNGVNTASIPSRTAVLIGSVTVGTVAGLVSDSKLFRNVSNFFNQQPRLISVQEPAASWPGSAVNAFRQMNNSTANQVIVTQTCDGLLADITAFAVLTHTAGFNGKVGIGINSTTISVAQLSNPVANVANNQGTYQALFKGPPGMGRSVIAPLENTFGSSAYNWISGGQSGLTGWVMN